MEDKERYKAGERAIAPIVATVIPALIVTVLMVVTAVSSRPKDESRSDRRARMEKMMKRGGELFFGEIFVKYEPLYDKAFARAKEMKVPKHMEGKKQELISRQERSFQEMKAAKLAFEAERKGGNAAKER